MTAAAGRPPPASQTLDDAEAPGPPFPIGGPTTSSWREEALTRIAELRTLTDWLEQRRRAEELDPATGLVDTIRGHLDTAKATARHRSRLPLASRLRAAMAGSDVERVSSNLDAAEADILRLAPIGYLRGQMPSLLSHVRSHLAADDPRRQRFEEITRDASRGALTEWQQDVVISVVRDAAGEARREIARVRSFRNVLLITASLLALLVLGVGAVGIAAPQAIPLCFQPPGDVVCPTHQAAVAPGRDADTVARDTASAWDLPLVEIVGLIAAALAAAVALRNIRGTSTPYSLPVALAVLKLPTGALTAVFGLLLMRGEFIPGLSALDFPAQIIAWAVVFGYAQELLTRLVDRQAHTVLDDVGGSAAKASPG
jgi:hypothetical protein